MTVSFNKFKNSPDNTACLIKALEYCDVVGAQALTFENGNYEFYEQGAQEVIIDVSNHGDTNKRKSAFLLKNKEKFTIDGGGSTFIFKGIMNAFTLIGCRNVTLKNLTIQFPDYPYPNGFVEEVTRHHFDLRFDSENVLIKDGALHVKSGEFCDRVHCDVRFDKNTHEIISGTGDNSLGASLNTLNPIRLENGCFRFFEPPVSPSKNDVFALLTGIRRASGILLDGSEDIVIENVTVNSCIGIGIMAQNCHNVSVEDCRVTAVEGRYTSSAADATHFVNCTGTIAVKRSLFEHMLDDALNVHGIYMKSVESNVGSTTLRFMNSASMGIDMYKNGDEVALLDADTLKPFDTFTVERAQVIDRENIRLEFKEKRAVPKDCIVENLTRYPELLFEGNIVQNNRARGMLIATNRKAMVRNNHFHTSGSAIVLECDGKFWYESGAIRDLVIENNIFDNCRYAKWDKGVISIPKGKKIVEGFYYHGTVKIKGNIFIGKNDVDLYADNVAEIIYKDNKGETNGLELYHIGKVKK